MVWWKTYESKLKTLGSNTTEDHVSWKLTEGAKGTQTSLFAIQRLYCTCAIKWGNIWKWVQRVLHLIVSSYDLDYNRRFSAEW
jgi:hypothetical protein